MLCFFFKNFWGKIRFVKIPLQWSRAANLQSRPPQRWPLFLDLPLVTCWNSSHIVSHSRQFCIPWCSVIKLLWSISTYCRRQIRWTTVQTGRRAGQGRLGAWATQVSTECKARELLLEGLVDLPAVHFSNFACESRLDGFALQFHRCCDQTRLWGPSLFSLDTALL